MTSPAADSVAPPGYTRPVIEPIRPTAVEPAAQAVAETEKPRRSLDLFGIPWRGLLIAVAVVAGCAVGYTVFVAKSDAESARQTISDYEHAIAAADGARACSLLSHEARMQVVAVGLRTGVHGGCTAVLGVAGSNVQSLVTQARSLGKGAQVESALSASGAKVVVDPTHQYAAAMPYGRPILMSRADGRWQIDSLTGDHTKLTPAHVSGASLAFAAHADHMCRGPLHKMNALLPALKSDLKQAAAGQPAPGLAGHIQAINTTENALIYRLSRLSAPPAQAPTFAAYMTAQENEIPIGAKALALAQQGNSHDAFLQFLLSAEAGQAGAQPTAQLGFKVC